LVNPAKLKIIDGGSKDKGSEKDKDIYQGKGMSF